MKNYIAITLISGSFIIAFLFICGWLYFEWYKRNKNAEIDYLTKYSDIQELLKNLPVTSKTYLIMYNKIQKLYQMKYRDVNMIKNLVAKFDKWAEPLKKK